MKYATVTLKVTVEAQDGAELEDIADNLEGTLPHDWLGLNDDKDACVRDVETASAVWNVPTFTVRLRFDHRVEIEAADAAEARKLAEEMVFEDENDAYAPWVDSVFPAAGRVVAADDDPHGSGLIPPHVHP